MTPDITKPIWLQPDFDAATYLYQYRAIYASAYDADTIRCLIDRGMGSWKVGTVKDGKPLGISIRLARIDAYEVRGENKLAGLNARNYVRSLLGKVKEFRIFTYKDEGGKYNRLLADILVEDNEEQFCLNDRLVELGHAVYKEY